MVKKTNPAGHGTRSAKQKKNYCFACGKDNPEGMRLKFRLAPDGKHFVSHFRLSKRYTGPPGHCHGGIIATVLDDAMSKLNKLHEVTAATSELTIDYLKPVPLHKRLRVESHFVARRGRLLTHTAEIIDENDMVLARGRGTFVIIDSHKVFRR